MKTFKVHKWLVEMVTLKAILFLASAANWPKAVSRKSVRNWVVIRGADKQRIEATADTPILPGDIVEIPESLF